MRAIRISKSDKVTLGAVHYWCRCNLHNGFRVRHMGVLGRMKKTSQFGWTT
jgi:hypothetical protein